MSFRDKASRMRGALILPAAIASLGAALLSRPALAAHRAAPTPVLVELFTAQGCAACPDANRRLGEIAGREGVLALTFPVDYWDYLGWRDTLAKPEFVERQRGYVARLKVREIYTPEIVVDGRQEAPAQDQARIDALIQTAATQRASAPVIRVARGGRRLTVSTRPGGGAEDVWLVGYDPAERDVRVKSGDNKGKLVAQLNVVRELVRLGRLSTRARTFPTPPPEEDGLKRAVLVQGVRGGPILAVKPLDSAHSAFGSKGQI